MTTDNAGEQQEEGKVDVGQLNAQLEAMKKDLAGANKAKEESESKLSKQDNELLSDEYLSFLEQRGKEESAAAEEVDYDNLTGSQLANLLTKKHGEELTKAKDEYEKRTSALQERMQKAVAYFDLELTKIRNPKLSEILDQEDGRKRFITLAQENPSWNSAKVYKQMKAEDLVQEKEQEESLEAKKEEESKIISEMETISPTATKPTKISKEEAARIAYRRAFGNTKE